MKIFYFTFILIVFTSFQTFSQSNLKNDSLMISKIYQSELTDGQAYMNLRDLCKNIGHRLSGSQAAEDAVKWAEKVLKAIPADTVFLQPVMVPHWIRGDREYAEVRFGGFVKPVDVIALGGSVGTGKAGLTAKVVEIHNFEELEKLGEENIKGKIVFFNRPMNPEHIQTFHAYGGCVDQRYKGASEAAKYGAVATVVRSMNLRLDQNPHTGAQHYDEGVQPIPTAAISTMGAELLSQAIKEDKSANFHLKMNCQQLPDVQSYNVIAEIKGSDFPNEIILVGGHLDSWDVGEGAHDDGAGVVHSMEVLQLFNKLNIRPRRTIRCVLFMNEENGLRGGKKYAELAEANKECHLAAIESDGGGFTPRGFTVAGLDSVKISCLSKIKTWAPLFEPYLVHLFISGYGGADINPLKKQGPALIGFVPDSQRYFDHHHARNDVFEEVNKRELELGAATIASLVYLLSEYGFEKGNSCP